MISIFSRRNKIDKEKQFVNKGIEDEMELVGFKRSKWRAIVSWTIVIFSFGFIHLLFKWIPRIYLIISHKRCPVKYAEKLLVIERYQKALIYHVVEVIDIHLSKQRCSVKSCNNDDCNHQPSDDMEDETPVTVYFENGNSKDFINCRMTEIKKCKYVWMDENEEFLKMSGPGPGLTNLQLYNLRVQDEEIRQKLIKLFGLNDMYIPVQSHFELFIDEITNPYYVYQTFCYIYWAIISYYTYAVAIFIWTFGSILLSVFQIHKAQKKLNETVHACDATFIKRKCKEEFITTDIKNLVPGDIIVVESTDSTVCCDAVLLSGTCIVNESMLTGESVPLTKTPLPKTEEMFSERDHCMNILYNGTKVIQTRKNENETVLALVLKTGFSTAKGKLVTSILYPSPVDYTFETGLFQLIYLIASIGLVAIAVVIIAMINTEGFETVYLIYYPLTLLTIILPVALPGALTLTKCYVVRRLKQQKIFCINSDIVNIAGTVDCACIDKTGTLTERNLDVWGVIPAYEGSFSTEIRELNLLEDNELKYALSTCHSLSIINGNIVGDPLDTKMFESTGWIFEEGYSNKSNPENCCPCVYPENGEIKIYIVEQNQFMSDLQRMSVLCENNRSDGLFVYCKGSAEVIASLSVPSTVPGNFASTLASYTSKGYRVIGLGWKRMSQVSSNDACSLTRSSIEADLTFLGLLILENKIKYETFEAIQTLRNGKFKIVMLTGDNVNTAMRVALDSKIIASYEDLIEIYIEDNQLRCVVKCEGVGSMPPEDKGDVEGGMKSSCYKLSLTGEVWDHILVNQPHQVQNILSKAAVFAKMTSRQKLQVVNHLQSFGYSVIMCGDGANDCGALKSANVGVSLSNEEASIASPFTSLQPNISCLPFVIREGRAGLVSSFGLVKFLLTSSWIEFLWSCLNIFLISIPTASQYIFLDIFIVTHLSLYFGLTPPYKGGLVPETPIISIINIIPVISILVHCLINSSFQILSLHVSSLFTSFHSPNQMFDQCYGLYCIVTFQYIIAALTFSQDYPYIQPWFKNKPYLIGALVSITLSLLLLFYPTQWIVDLFDFEHVIRSIYYSFASLGLTFLNLILCFVFEKVFMERIIFKKFREWNRRRRLKYISIEETTKSKEWMEELINPIKRIERNENIQSYVNEAFSF